MKQTMTLLLAILCCGVLTLAGQEKKEHEHQFSVVQPNPAFDKVKSLAGEWIGTSPGATGKSSYRIMSAGSSVVLIQDGDKPGNEMVSVFHPDGADLLMTHYCAAKNSPRMKLQPGRDPNVLRFTFLDATNLADPQIGHMTALTLHFIDKDHHTQEWTFTDHGKEMTDKFEFRRAM